MWYELYKISTYGPMKFLSYESLSEPRIVKNQGVLKNCFNYNNRGVYRFYQANVEFYFPDKSFRMSIDLNILKDQM